MDTFIVRPALGEFSGLLGAVVAAEAALPARRPGG
jgi:hypothetical protein